MQESQGQPRQERRRQQRWPAYLGGGARFLKQLTVNVLIRNTCASGAKLVVNVPNLVPSEFTLSVPKRQKEYRAIARWRHGNEIGVEFI